MTHPDVIPPDTDTGDGDGGGKHLELEINVHTEASEQTVASCWYDAAVTDPARFADELLGLARAIASLRGDDYVWALMQRLNGGRP